MSGPGSPFDGLLELARECLDRLRRELLRYGVTLPPGLEVHPGDGLFCCYDLQDRRIYLGLPDPRDPIGQLRLALFRPALACATDAEMAALTRLLLPRLLAHEVGHALRHAAGLFGEDRWHEEQVANVFAAAATAHWYPPAETTELARLLERSLDSLARELGGPDAPADTHHDLLHSLAATGDLEPETVRTMELIRELLAAAPEQLLRDYADLAPPLRERLALRMGLVAQFNQEYTSRLFRYLYLQIGWMLLDLVSSRRHYLDEFLREHLGRRPELLPPPPDDPEPGAAEIRSCRDAHHALRNRSPVAARYFYKRYRSLLLQAADRDWERRRGCRPVPGGELRDLPESPHGDEQTLALLAPLVSSDLAALFPSPGGPPLPTPDPAHFAAETDHRLWAHACDGADDPAAAATLERLALLDGAELTRGLSAGAWMEIIHRLVRLAAAEGETLFWEGSRNEDVLILAHGRLEILLEAGAETRRLGEVLPGEVVGELAFLTGEPRSATLRAVEPSECLVLRAATLRAISLAEPAVMTYLGGVIARRLKAANRARP